MNAFPIQVLKFGSSVLADADSLDQAVHEIYRCWRQGQRVIAVVSAVGDTTDRLLQRAHQSTPRPDAGALAELLATGEAESVALLNLALGRVGIPAAALDASRVGLRTCGPQLDARPVGLDHQGLLRRLQQTPVLVVPGFVGVHPDGGLSLLGRGGSDLSALYLAHCLDARCRLLKDVAGLYEWDPARPGPEPAFYPAITYEDALALDGAILQHKAVEFARAHGIRFEVGRCGAALHSEVGAEATTRAVSPPPKAPLRVCLLGLGNVGFGVWRHLQRHPGRFEVVSILVRSTAAPRLDGVDAALLCTDLEHALAVHPEVVVDAAGYQAYGALGLERIRECSRAFITADKEVMVLVGEGLHSDAVEGFPVGSSATVGGGMPALEGVTRTAAAAGVRSLCGVLNGTCNFVLDRVAEGAELEQAVAEAQQFGFAEADAQADLDGSDAARKLVILARAAWGGDLAFEDVVRRGIDTLTPDDLVPRAGQVLRLLAHAEELESGRIRARVEVRWLPQEHPLAQARAEGNALWIEDRTGHRRLLTGKGAGRWPTAEAVFADLMELWRASPSDAPARQEARA